MGGLDFRSVIVGVLAAVVLVSSGAGLAAFATGAFTSSDVPGTPEALLAHQIQATSTPRPLPTPTRTLPATATVAPEANAFGLYQDCLNQLLAGNSAARSGGQTATFRSYVDTNCVGFGLTIGRDAPGAIPCDTGSDLVNSLDTLATQNVQLGVDPYFAVFARREISAAMGTQGCTLVRAPAATATPVPSVGAQTVTNSLLLTGSAILVADDGTYLGKLTSNRFDPDSICNPYGAYGSQYSTTSIRNRYGTYGSRYSTLGAYNRFTSTPPKILQNGLDAGYVTKNTILMRGIDPDSLLISLGCPSLVRD